MDLLVNPSEIRGGTLTVPGDKSISHRALMFSAIADGTCTINGFLNGEDCLATMSALRQMGVDIRQNGKTSVRVTGCGKHGLRAPGSDLDMGNSGTAMRLFAGLLAAQEFACRLIGDESLSSRPMARIIGPLGEMNAVIESNDGRPPLDIRGNPELSAIHYHSPVASAQVKSAILLAGLYADGRTSVSEPAVTRDHTERMLQSMGVELEVVGNTVSISDGQSLRAIDIDVPADLSSAAFPMLATVLSDDGELCLPGVGVNPTRTGYIDILRQMGGNVELRNQRHSGAEPIADIVVKSSTLHGIDVDPALVSLAIDEFPLLFVAAACAEGETRFSGIGELRVKESDRIASMAAGISILGGHVVERPDGAVVRGGPLGSGTVECFGDHRIAMAFAVAASCCAGPVRVKSADAVNTSFPAFVESMRTIGLDISMGEGL